MEWKEGNISTARELYQKALSINTTTESAARCLQVIRMNSNACMVNNNVGMTFIHFNLSVLFHCHPLQAWGVLEQRAGNLSAARRLFRSSLNINSQSYVTWMTWAQLEDDQGNSVRAEEIRNLYFQQVSNRLSVPKMTRSSTEGRFSAVYTRILDDLVI
jgi:tetratricopeptide (TPR) repeat protein